MLEKYGQDGDRARDFNDEWGGLHFKRSFPYVVDDRVKVAYYFKKNSPKRISQSNPWRNWAEDKDADGWIKGCITEVDYFGGVYVAFDKPAKKRKQKNSPQRTLEDQYLSWDILRTTRKNTILRRLRQQRDEGDEEETESEWEWDDGEQEKVGGDEEEQQDNDGDYDLDQDGNVQYY